MNDVLKAIHAAVGHRGLLTGAEVRARPANIKGGECAAAAVVRPDSTEALSRVLAACHRAGQPVVPVGGGTGLVDGALAAPGDVVVSLERMNRVERVDTVGRTARVQAGVALATVQGRAEDAGLSFAVDFGARGTATIGGAIATNAGGNRVLRYGMMREQVLGIEAVLADGTVVSSLKPFLKNNTGYDIKQLFIGSEGTLGIVTRAVLRLRPAPRSRTTAMLAVEEFAALPRLLTLLDSRLGGGLGCFEVMWNDFYRLVLEASDRHVPPLAKDYPYYVLVESLGAGAEQDEAVFQSALSEAMSAGIAVDASIAVSRAQQSAMWAIRDDIEALMTTLSPLYAFDVSLALDDMEGYVIDVRSRLLDRWPGARCVVFGHLGDGNLHLVVSPGEDTPAAKAETEEIVYGALRGPGGSISAEHGIGLEKKAYLPYSRSASELAVMRSLKQALDPAGILNPGKVL